LVVVPLPLLPPQPVQAITARSTTETLLGTRFKPITPWVRCY